MRALRNRSKATCLLRVLLFFGVDAEAHFVCDVRVLSSGFIQHTVTSWTGVSLSVKRSLGVRVGLVHADTRGGCSWPIVS